MRCMANCGSRGSSPSPLTTTRPPLSPSHPTSLVSSRLISKLYYCTRQVVRLEIVVTRVKKKGGKGRYGRGEEERRRVRQDFRYFGGADTFLFTLRCRLQIVRLRSLAPPIIPQISVTLLRLSSISISFDGAHSFAAAVAGSGGAWCTMHCGTPKLSTGAAVSDGRLGGKQKTGWLEWRFSFGLKSRLVVYARGPFCYVKRTKNCPSISPFPHFFPSVERNIDCFAI